MKRFYQEISGFRPQLALLTLITPIMSVSPAAAEPMYDNNGFTIRDKIPTLALGFGERRQSYKRLGQTGSTIDLEAQCWDVAYAYGTEIDQATYLSFSYCPEPGIEDGPTNEDRSATVISVGYLYAAPQGRTEGFSELNFVDYPAITDFGFIPSEQTSLSFGGFEWIWGFSIDIVDGPRFSITAGYEFELYSRYEVNGTKVDIHKLEPNSAFLKASYLFGDHWAGVLRLGGTGREGEAFSVMRSF